MKKFRIGVVLMLITAMSVVFAACGSESDEKGTTTENVSQSNDDLGNNSGKDVNNTTDTSDKSNNNDNIGNDVGDAIEDVGDGVGDAVKDVGDGVGEGVDNITDDRAN